MTRHLRPLGAPTIVLVAGALAYLNSFQGAFVFDDDPSIVQNGAIHGFTGLGGDRALVKLSLALNYRLGGLDPRGYHLVNLVVHLLAALALYGLVRRVLDLPRLRERFAGAATWCAFAASLLWAVHPVQTESVTYVVQRAESMMGLFYLLTLYAAVRAATSEHPWRWVAVAIVACAAGMSSKLVMVTAPLAALLLDWSVITRSLRTTLRRRWPLHGGLAATWAMILTTRVPASMLGARGPDHLPTAGFGFEGCTPLEYLATQPAVLLHYLRLSLWPRPLCIDYGWPFAQSAAAVVMPTLILLAIVALVGVALCKRPAVGVVGVLFFLVLAPTSSVVPFADAAVEHRMYLPLAAVVVLSVVAGHAVLVRRLDQPRLAVLAVIAIAGCLAAATADRNRDYHDPLRLWQSAAETRPDHGRPFNEVGAIFSRRGRPDLALPLYERAVELQPLSWLFQSNLGSAYLQLGRLEDGAARCRAAVVLRPSYAPARANLAIALIELGRHEEGLAQLREALRLRPDDAGLQANLRRATARAGAE